MLLQTTEIFNKYGQSCIQDGGNLLAFKPSIIKSRKMKIRHLTKIKTLHQNEQKAGKWKCTNKSIKLENK